MTVPPHLGQNSVPDLSPLTDLTDLTVLGLEDISVLDLGPLSGLTVGVVMGIVKIPARTLVGAYELITAPFALPGYCSSVERAGPERPSLLGLTSEQTTRPPTKGLEIVLQNVLANLSRLIT